MNLWSLAIFLSALVQLAQSQIDICATKNCDCNYKIIHCFCKNTSIFPATGAHLNNINTTLDHFTVTGCDQVRLPSYFFRHTRIATVVIKNSKDVDIEPYAFSGTNYLTTIQLVNTSIQTIQQYSFSNINIATLHFRKVEIGNIATLYSFKNASFRTGIIFEHCHIQIINDGCFHLAYMTALVFTQSHIDILQPHSLLFRQITRITISNSRIGIVHRNAFTFNWHDPCEISLEITHTTIGEIGHRFIYAPADQKRINRFIFSHNRVLRAGADLPFLYDLTKYRLDYVEIINNTFLYFNAVDRDWNSYQYMNIGKNIFNCDSNLCSSLRHIFPLINQPEMWTNFERMLLNGASCIPKQKEKFVQKVYSKFTDYEECQRVMTSQFNYNITLIN